jgi:hypothetical protein
MRDLNFSVNLQLEIIDMLHFIIIALFVLLLLSVVCWLLVYRQFDPKSMKAHPWYKLHQVLVALIAFMIILCCRAIRVIPRTIYSGPDISRID